MTTKHAAPARVNLWVNHAGYWLLEMPNAPLAEAQAAYRAKVEAGTDPQDLRIFDSGYAGTPS